MAAQTIGGSGGGLSELVFERLQWPSIAQHQSFDREGRHRASKLSRNMGVAHEYRSGDGGMDVGRDAHISFHGWIVGLGTIIALVIVSGLMALMFHSSGSGHEEAVAVHVQDARRDEAGRQ